MAITRRACLSAFGAAAIHAQSERPRLRRADSFFGLHFDLHPQEKDTALGRDVTEEMAGDLIARVRPDYVQYDAKGHAGWLGWPSKVGPSAPGIVRDSLAVWRKVTAREGVALYIHFSGVWDSEAVRRHPEWARLDADGKPDGRNTSTCSPYADELMIPQLREAATLYELDGAWMDGECWSTQPDYSKWMIEAWKKAGHGDPPREKSAAGWLEWLEFNREQFRGYVRHYVEALRESHPKFQVASNWLYSTFVPEEPTLPVDFLSGDYLGNASISTARLQARYLAQTGRPWDLMAWGFQQANSNTVGHIHKPAVQLQQEASVVLAQGGGFQVYYQPSRAGHFEAGHVQVMSDLAVFCRQRQRVCHRSETVPQIGVVFSRHSLYSTTGKLFGGWGRAEDPARGFVDALLACGYSVDVIPDWKLTSAAQYPLVVLPDWTDPGETATASLQAHARRGGRILVAGAENAKRWAGACGLQISGEPVEGQWYLPGSGPMANVKGLWLDIEEGAGKVLAQRFPVLDGRKDGKAAALAAPLGAGEAVLLPGPYGALYAATHAPALREFLGALVRPRFRPMVVLDGPPTLEMALRRQRGQVVAHLLNATNMQVAGDHAAIDYVPPVGPVRLRFPEGKVRSVRLEPEGTQLKVNGDAVTIPQIHLHTAVVVEG